MSCTKRVFIFLLSCFAIVALVGTAVATDDRPSVGTDARFLGPRAGNIDPADAAASATERQVNDQILSIPGNVGTPAAPCFIRTNQCGDTLNLFWFYDLPRNDTISCGSFQNPFEALDNPTLIPETLKTVNWFVAYDADTAAFGNEGMPDLRLTITGDNLGLPDTTLTLATIDRPWADWTSDGAIAEPTTGAFQGLLPFDLSAFNIVIPVGGRVHAMIEVSNRWEVTRSINTISFFSDEADETGGGCIGNTFHGGFYRNRSNFGDPALDTVCFGGAGQIRAYQYIDDLFGPENWAMNWEVCPEFPPPVCDTYMDNCLDLNDLNTTLGLCFFMPSGVSPRKAAVAEFRGSVGSQPCTLKTVSFFICDWSTTTYDTLGAIVDTGTAVDVDVVITDGIGGTEVGRKTVPGATVQTNWLNVAYNVADFTSDNIVLPPGGVYFAMIEVAGARLGDPGFTMAADIGAFDPANCGAPEVADYMMYVDDTDGTVDPGDTTYITLVDAFAYDLGWGINVDLCCAPSTFALCTPATDADWETQGNGIGRPNATTASISNVCGLQTAWSVEIAGLCRSLEPIIAGDQVFVTGTDAIYAFDKASGTMNWTNGGFPLILGDVKGAVTAADTGVYVPGAGARSFTKYDATTGAVLWSRNATTTPLDDGNGQLNWTGSIVTGGFVYFGQETGNIYKLDAGTGATAGFITLPDFPTAIPYNAMASDGVKLWVGTMDPAQASPGSIFQIDMATFTIDWQLTNPSQTFTGDAVFYTFDGFLAGLAYEDGVLYYTSLMPPDGDAFPNTGGVGAIDVATETGIGDGILWVHDIANAFMASPGFSPTSSVTLAGAPAIGPGFIYTSSYGRWGGTTEPDGLAAWSKTLGLRIWYVGYSNIGVSGGVPVSDDGRSDNPPTVICQPDGTPYLFTGHVDGTHRFSNGNDGTKEWYRTFTGRVRSTAVGEDCVAVTVRNGDPATGGGSLVVYAVGNDRARLQIDSQFVFRTATPLDGAVGDLITDAFQNTGCVDLNVSGYTVVNPPAVRVTTINPNLASVGRAAARNLGGYDRFLDLMSDKDLAIAKSVGFLEEETEENLARRFARASSAADPVFLTVNSGASAVAAGGTQTLDVTYDETGLTNNTGYINYIEIASDDPDYYPQGLVDFTGVTTPGAPYIEFNLFIGCPDASDLMTIGQGTAWITNWGAEGGGGNFSTDDSEDGFIVNGHDWMFDGGWAMALQDSTHWAFEGCSVGGYPRRAGEWGPTLPCGVSINSTSYDSPLGVGADAVEEVTFNMIDLASTNGFFTPSIRQMGGVFVEVTRVGAQAADMGDFVVAEFNITNEAGDPGDIVGAMNDIYFGLEIDWDIDAGTDNFVYSNAAGYAAYDGGVAGGGSAAYICGHSRLDADAYGSGALGSGSAPTFMMGDIMNDQGRGNRAMDILSNPSGYGATVDPASTANTDIGAIFTAINIPTLADGATESVYMAVYLVANGENGLPWSDAAGFEAAVAEVQCRAAAFAGFGKGDVTCDGVVDLQDVVALGNIIDGLFDPTGTGGVYTADVNGDNDWTQADYDLLYDVVAGVQPASAMANGWRF